MIARSDDTKGLGVRPAVVLRAAKQVELAHRHGQVSFFRQAGDEAVKGAVFVADAPNQRAPPRFIEWQDAKKVFEAPREAVRTIVVLRVDVAELAGGSDEHVLAGLNVDAGVDPGFFAGYLDFL